jgi:hypothetical protein
MPLINNLYDAIVSPRCNEDKCTNLLVWLLKKLPPETISTICNEIGLAFEVKNYLHTRVQFVFPKSRPDAVFEADGKQLILETKLFQGRFDCSQFLDHINGAIGVFGQESVYFIFLSMDKVEPNDVRNIRKRFPEKIAFISWLNLLQILNDSIRNTNRQYAILIREFLLFANHYKLGRIVSMNQNELSSFIDIYAKVFHQKDSANQIFLKFMKELRNRLVAHSSERAEPFSEEEDSQVECPCFYFVLTINGWHIKRSAYLFLNVYTKSIGVLLTGYQSDAKEKKVFIDKWNNGLKEIYAKDKGLKAFTWIEHQDVDAIEGRGYFKESTGINGKLINPTKIEDVSEFFYWGYSFDFIVNRQSEYLETIPVAFEKLINDFGTNIESKEKQKRRNKIARAK